MGKIVDIDANKPHEVSECMCVKCLHRWIDVRPEGVWLKGLECPGCGQSGYVICTGQPIDEERAVL